MSNQKRSRGRMMIRRRRATEPATAPEHEAVASPQKGEDDSGEGFVARNSVDFFTNDDIGDFIPDNELRLSDEIFSLYEESLGERVAQENKPAFDAMAKLENTLAGL